MITLSRLLLLLLILSSPVQAASVPDWARRARNEATDAMKKGQWEDALKVFKRVDKTMEGRDFIRTDWLGWFVYHRGLSELRLEKFEAAMKSFERYYKDYPSSS
ncbi:hypothetical protein N9124_00380 [bacterium]|nr:hypothetical protein [Akkermansiaceae bacterium]MDB4289432.1 hypothetical protein [bacterium]MDA8968487.1 hypothetical protein [Akkermansiaceae bacterium]MDB0055518.1 hypothetical protein [Akkermansiaceae bacterium]MDB4143538.1 hypothetical protein [Akkermansiaceae bacterium]